MDHMETRIKAVILVHTIKNRTYGYEGDIILLVKTY